MKVTIDTKFNVGDTVYIADHYYDFYASSEPCIIRDVLIDINSKRTHIAYEVEQKDFTYRVPETWTFASYDECAQWCDLKNKGE